MREQRRIVLVENEPGEWIAILHGDQLACTVGPDAVSAFAALVRRCPWLAETKAAAA